MTMVTSFVLWLIMLLMLVQLIPIGGKWVKPIAWSIAVLITVIVVLLGGLHFK